MVVIWVSFLDLESTVIFLHPEYFLPSILNVRVIILHSFFFF